MANTLPTTLKVRINKHPAKRGICKAVAYRNNIFDPVSDIEALIEAYGANEVKRFVDLINDRRKMVNSKHFTKVSV